MTHDKHEALIRKKLISGTKWAVAVRVATQAFSWIVTLIMVRLLAPVDYGLNAMIEVPIELLMLVSTLGIDAAIIRFNRRDAVELASSFGLLLLVNAVLFVVVLMSAGLIAAYFREPRLTLLIQVTALVFVLAPFRVIPNALLDMDLDFKLKSQVELVASVISSLVALVLAVMGAGVWALVAAILMTAVLKGLLLSYLRPWLVRPAFKTAPIQDLLRYGFLIMLGAAVGVIAGRVLNLLAGPHLGAEVLGFFTVASVFAMLPMSKVMPIVQQTMFPAIALLRGQPDQIKKYLLKSLEMSAMIIFPLAVGMACISGHVVAVVFGEKWSAVVLPMALLSAMVPLRLINQIFYAPLNAVGQAKSVLIIHATSLLIFAVGALFAVRFGLMGLVYLTALAVVVTTLIAIEMGRRVFRVSVLDVFLAVLPAFVSTMIMGLAVWGFERLLILDKGIFSLILEVLGGATVYALSMLMLFKTKIQQIKDVLIK